MKTRHSHQNTIAATIVSLLVSSAVSFAATVVDFGASPVGPITNNGLGAGDFLGTEYLSLGVRFTAAPSDGLNIGAGSGAGDPNNALGAFDVNVTDFNGTFFITFELGGIPQVTDSIRVAYINPTLPGTRTIIRDIDGLTLLDQPAGSIDFSAPGIASIESRLTFDAADTVIFGNLTPVPEPASLALFGLGALALIGRRIS